MWIKKEMKDGEISLFYITISFFLFHNHNKPIGQGRCKQNRRLTLSYCSAPACLFSLNHKGQQHLLKSGSRVKYNSVGYRNKKKLKPRICLTLLNIFLKVWQIFHNHCRSTIHLQPALLSHTENMCLWEKKLLTLCDMRNILIIQQ